MPHHHQHAERFDAQSQAHHRANTQLNLLDICNDSPRSNHGDSFTALGRRALERELIEQARPYGDKVVSNLVNALEQLDQRGTRSLEQRTGKTPLTKMLDKTRHERYRMLQIVAKEALNVAETVTENDL